MVSRVSSYLEGRTLDRRVLEREKQRGAKHYVVRESSTEFGWNLDILDVGSNCMLGQNLVVIGVEDVDVFVRCITIRGSGVVRTTLITFPVKGVDSL